MLNLNTLNIKLNKYYFSKMNFKDVVQYLKSIVMRHETLWVKFIYLILTQISINENDR